MCSRYDLPGVDDASDTLIGFPWYPPKRDKRDRGYYCAIFTMQDAVDALRLYYATHDQGTRREVCEALRMNPKAFHNAKKAMGDELQVVTVKCAGTARTPVYGLAI